MRQILWTLAALAIVFFGPNSMSLLQQSTRRNAMRSKIFPVGIGIAVMATFITMWSNENSSFLYFQF